MKDNADWSDGPMRRADYVNPYTKDVLFEDDEGVLFSHRGDAHARYRHYDGVYDFTLESEEQRHYDDQYESSQAKDETEELDLQEALGEWEDSRYPGRAVMFDSLGDLRGKRVLLLGNGASSKELYFAELGAQVVYTDLSLRAVRMMKDRCTTLAAPASAEGTVEFHAVDALHMPYPDESFDVIYGGSFAHHIDDLNALLQEVNRCLARGGRCRFVDGAYSPVWQFAKATVLRPLQLYTHRKTGLSPEDHRATKEGGYRESEIITLMHETGFTNHMFLRGSFFQRLYIRGVGKLLGNHRLIRRDAPLSNLLRRLDDFLSRNSSVFRKNTLNLVWGFDKG